MSIAFFDFDLTLIAANSARLWLRRELALGHLGRSQVVRASYWLARYQLGLGTLDDAVGRAIAQLEGTDAAQLKARTRSFYERQVRQLYRPGARARVLEHRRANDRFVLLTSSSNYLAELVAEELGFDGVLCNRFEVDDLGRHTGRTVDGLCYGAGKLTFAQAEATRRNTPLTSCVFYTDSYSDLPVLLKVGRPVVVNPDLRLQRHAARSGWEIVDWGAP